jgi:hypothetical protein
MSLPVDLKIDDPLWSVAPVYDEDDNTTIYEPVETKVHWMEVIDNKLFINDCLHTFFFLSKAEAYLLCDYLNAGDDIL